MLSRRSVLLGGLGCLVSSPALAWQDEWYSALLNDRGRHDRIIHLYGDSIFHGWALRDFPEALDPAHPLYAFRSIPSMANAALQDNGCTVRFAYGGAAIGDPAAPQTIRDRIAAGVIRSGDVVVFEDAGSHGSDPAAYCAQWQALRAAAGDRHDIID